MAAVDKTPHPAAQKALAAQPFSAARRVVRRHSLASDHRAGSWARVEARQKQSDFLRRNWTMVLAWSVIVVMVVSISAALVPDGFTRGLVVGGGLVSAGFATWQLVIQVTGTAPIMMGDLGEQWTAQELRKLRRRGWLLVNHVTLTKPDTDHVLIGPGGIAAIESKWSAHPWTPNCTKLHAAAEQARCGARRLTLWHGLKHLGVGTVGSVVFLWGPGARGLEGPFDMGGTTVVPGHAAPSWRVGLAGGRLSPAQVDAAWQVLDARCRQTDPEEALRHPAPLSIRQLYFRALASFAAACGGLLAVSSVVATGLSWGLVLVWWALMLLLGLGACRIPQIRYVGLAWTAGVIAVALLFAISLIIQVA